MNGLRRPHSRPAPVGALRTWLPRLAAGISLAVTGVLAASMLADCSSTGAAGSAPSTVASVPRHATTTNEPNRDGPYAVGKRTLTFVDSTRKTPPNGNLPERQSRTLETIVEYPASGTADPTHEIQAAAPAPGQFPIVVYLHGLGAHADNPYLHPWAASGFVALAPKFPLTNADTPGGPNPADALNEPTDVSFVLSQMFHLPETDADLRRIIDPNRVGVMGASLGASIALDVAYNRPYKDPRVKAAIAQSGGCIACPRGPEDRDGAYFTGPSVPLMLMHGTADPFAPYEQSAQEYERAPGPKYFLSLVGAKHIQYSEPWLSISARATIDFFDRYLKNEGGRALQLRTDANVAGKATLQQSPQS